MDKPAHESNTASLTECQINKKGANMFCFRFMVHGSWFRTSL